MSCNLNTRYRILMSSSCGLPSTCDIASSIINETAKVVKCILTTECANSNPATLGCENIKDYECTDSTETKKTLSESPCQPTSKTFEKGCDSLSINDNIPRCEYITDEDTCNKSFRNEMKRRSSKKSRVLDETPADSVLTRASCASSEVKKMSDDKAWVHLTFSLDQIILTCDQFDVITRGIVAGFEITDSAVTLRIVRTLRTLEQIYYFEKNVGLYTVATQFLFYIKRTKPFMFVGKDSVTTIQLLCFMIVHKYFIDNPWNNQTIAQIFCLDLKKLNLFEMQFLKHLGFAFPLQLVLSV